MGYLMLKLQIVYKNMGAVISDLLRGSNMQHITVEYSKSAIGCENLDINILLYS